MMEKTIKIIETILENKNISIREISKKSGIDYKNAYYLIKNLSGILKMEKVGNSYKIELNKRYHPLVIMAEYERRKKILKNKTAKVIFNTLRSLNFQFITIVFGSFLKRKKYGDIDLLIICEKKYEKTIEEALSILPLPLHLNFFSYQEFISMVKSREFNVVNEALKSYVVLIGIEDFCRLIENVK